MVLKNSRSPLTLLILEKTLLSGKDKMPTYNENVQGENGKCQKMTRGAEALESTINDL